MNIHYLQHVPFEGPGYIKEWAGNEGHSLTSTRLYETTQFPAVDNIDLLFVLGGPMGVYDETDYPWLQPEKEFIGRCLPQNVKIVGICLGAQLIADVMGAAVYTMKEPEIGWFPITWNSECRKLLGNDIPDKQTVLHWHGDTFELPSGAELLASSNYCTNQAFLVKRHILGLQFHLEMRADDVSKLVQNSHPKTGPHVQAGDKILESEQHDSTHEIFTVLIKRFIDL